MFRKLILWAVIFPFVLCANEDSQAKNVMVHMTLTDIGSINEVDGSFRCELFLAMSWPGDNRANLPNKNVDKAMQKISKEEISWSPDVIFVNARSVKIPNAPGDVDYFSRFKDGTLLRMTLLQTVMNCPMDLREFPFDTPTCEIKLESMYALADTMQLVWDPHIPFNVESNLTLKNFELEKVTTNRCNKVYSTGEFSCVKLNLKFKRVPCPLVMQFYVPAGILTFLATLAFWINGRLAIFRLCFTLAILLSLFAIQIISGKYEPDTTDYTHLVKYRAGLYIIVIMALIQQTLCVIFSSRDFGKTGAYTFTGNGDDSPAYLPRWISILDKIFGIVLPLSLIIFIACVATMN